MQTLSIPIIEGTVRPGSRTGPVARFIYEIGKTIEEIDVKLIRSDQFTLPFDGNDDENRDPKFTEITEKADGFFVVVPEYNHSFPGTLKRLMDSELKNYIHKPVVFAGVSDGPWGGVRAIESLVNAVREMGLITSFRDVQFPHADTLFDEKGNILDSSYIPRVEKVYKELIWLARTLKQGREN